MITHILLLGNLNLELLTNKNKEVVWCNGEHGQRSWQERFESSTITKNQEMKKFILSILVALLVSSCNESVIISKEEYNKLKGDTVKPEYPKLFSVNDKDYSISLGSDGHEYYGIYLGIGGYSGETKFFHYADCKKCNLRDSVIFSYLQYLTH